MELYRVRNTFGYSELLWALRHWFSRRRSSHWLRVSGFVEGYELLMARENGWLVVFYSYQLDGTEFSGEWRKWIVSGLSSLDSQVEKITFRLPIGTAVRVRVDPKALSRSIAEL
jgi:hypothetical protein